MAGSSGYACGIEDDDDDRLLGVANLTVMSTFEKNLQALPSIDHYARMELYSDGIQPAAVIENDEGNRGSLRIYYHVSLKWGGIGPAAAKEAIELYAEHADDARANPGKHPNIDRLFHVIENDEYYSVRCYHS